MFYRHVKQEDFDDYLKRYSFVLRDMSEDTKELTLSDMEEAIIKHIGESDKDRHESHKACQVYRDYIRAKRDFDKGEFVGIQY